MPAGFTRAWLHEVAFALDCLLNAITGGWASEPLSARAYRRQHEERWLGALRWLLDAALGEKHCQDSYEWLPARLHFPPELRG
jgi:hypothetical protein